MLTMRKMEGFEHEQAGLCGIDCNSNGWFRSLGSNGKIVVDATLTQAWSRFFPFAKVSSAAAIIDTGSPVTIISRSLFEGRGFKLPSSSAPVTALPHRGLVNESYLSGWPGVEMKIGFDYAGFDVEVPLPQLSVKAVVATNVDDSLFLIGMDVIRRLPMVLSEGYCILLSHK